MDIIVFFVSSYHIQLSTRRIDSIQETRFTRVLFVPIMLYPIDARQCVKYPIDQMILKDPVQVYICYHCNEDYLI